MNTKPTPDQIFTVYGNMGGDPDQRTIEARTFTKSVYSPVIDGPEERTWDQPEINFLTFSIATGGYDDKPLVWLPCVDWDGLAFRARKGDQVEVTGGSAGPGPTSTRRTGQGEGWPPDRRHGLAGKPGRRRSSHEAA
jgi:hypothetical protein